MAKQIIDTKFITTRTVLYSCKVIHYTHAKANPLIYLRNENLCQGTRYILYKV